MNQKRTTIILPAELWQAVKAQAAAEKRSVNNWLVFNIGKLVYSAHKGAEWKEGREE